MVSTKYSALCTDKRPELKCYGKLPQAKTVKITDSPVPLEQLRLQLIQSIVKPGMIIQLDYSTELRIDTVDTASDICLATAQTGFEESRPESEEKVAPVLSTLTALRIEDAKTSLDRAFNRLFDLIASPIIHHEALMKLSKTGRPPSLPKGLLLSGPPGCGKTFLVRRIVDALGIPLVTIAGPSIISSTSGESEENLRQAFLDAEKLASRHPMKTSILFMDEVDAIGGKREGSQEPESLRLVAQLLVLMDGSRAKEVVDVRVVVVGATNRPDDLDLALRRPGRFDIELVIDPPTIPEREALLRKLFALRPSATVDFAAVARATIGYVPADLAALHRETVLLAMEEQEEAPTLHICTQHVIKAMRRVGPSLIRDYRVTVEPDVTLDSIGGYEEVKNRLETRLLGPLREPERYARFNLRPSRGALLYGPPGCSKTTFAKALANTAGCSFFSLNGASVFSSYVGEAERIIRDTFAAARMTSPSIIFVDEIDALVGKRSVDGEVRDQVQERVLTTFLIELDGVTSDANPEATVILLAATNRLDAIDSAILRPGRFDELIHIPLPNPTERLSILKVVSKRTPLTQEVDLAALAERTEGYSGAQLKNLVQEAGYVALRKGASVVDPSCIEAVLSK